MAERSVVERVKVPGTAMLGVATGMATADFITEFTTRGLGIAGDLKLLVKAVGKVVLAFIEWALAGRFFGLMSWFVETMSYGSLGSIVLDLLARVYPGGVVGAAQAAATAVRRTAVGARVVGQKLTEVSATPSERVAEVSVA